MLPSNNEFHLPDFTPSKKHERPYSADERASIVRWHDLATLVRKPAAYALYRQMRKAPGGDLLLTKFIAQYKRHVAPGSDDPRFHVGNGMTIRNMLRTHMMDHELPDPQNWDEWYVGALYDVVANSESYKQAGERANMPSTPPPAPKLYCWAGDRQAVLSVLRDFFSFPGQQLVPVTDPSVLRGLENLTFVVNHRPAPMIPLEIMQTLYAQGATIITIDDTFRRNKRPNQE